MYVRRLRFLGGLIVLVRNGGGAAFAMRAADARHLRDIIGDIINMGKIPETTGRTAARADERLRGARMPNVIFLWTR